MSMFGAKKCPNCGQPQEKSWDRCPFCANMQGAGGGMAMGGQQFPPPMGPPPGPPPGGFPPPQGYPPQQGYGGAPMPMAAPAAPQRTVALMAGAGPLSSPQQLGWLVGMKGPMRGELITLKPLSVIGKDPTCDVVFNDPFMSGRHATIRSQPTGFVLEDHSTNGTFVNDKKVKTHELVDSDFVKFGQTLVKFKAL